MATALPFPLQLGTLPTPDPGTFYALFPEFMTAGDALIQSRLDQAELQIEPAIWGARAGEGQAYLAAHLLAISPGGQFARLSSDKAETTYGARFKELCYIVGALALGVT